MPNAFLVILDNAPRRVFALLSLVCLIMLVFGLYLQHSQGLQPCPMCIVQRYALVSVVIVAGLLSASGRERVHFWGAMLLLLAAGFGAFVAARQTWLQWYPPHVTTCGRDFYGMIENFPLNRAIPMIFRGSGDCSAVDWTFLGGSIANWSFISFSLITVLASLMIWRKARGVKQAAF